MKPDLFFCPVRRAVFFTYRWLRYVGNLTIGVAQAQQPANSIGIKAGYGITSLSGSSAGYLSVSHSEAGCLLARAGYAKQAKAAQA
jgi:hypothetical protein